MQTQERAKVACPVDHNGVPPNTGVAPIFTEMAYITTYLDPSAGMEVMLWRDIRAMFMDAVYARHNSPTPDFLKDTNGGQPHLPQKSTTYWAQADSSNVMHAAQECASILDLGDEEDNCDWGVRSGQRYGRSNPRKVSSRYWIGHGN